jgi:uncharacterized membrane protein
MIGIERKLIWFGFNKINLILYIICVTWLLIILVTPAAQEPDSIHFSDEGYVSRDEYFSDIEGIENPFTRAVYHSGDRMCHLKESRSLFINSNQMPYCARDFGIFFGFALGAAIATFFRVDLRWWILVLGLAPIGLDGGIQLLTSYESTNILRILTGTLAGVVTMLALGLVAAEVSQDLHRWVMNKVWMSKNNHPKRSKTNDK